MTFPIILAISAAMTVGAIPALVVIVAACEYFAWGKA